MGFASPKFVSINNRECQRNPVLKLPSRNPPRPSPRQYSHVDLVPAGTIVESKEVSIPVTDPTLHGYRPSRNPQREVYSYQRGVPERSYHRSPIHLKNTPSRSEVSLSRSTHDERDRSVYETDMR